MKLLRPALAAFLALVLAQAARSADLEIKGLAPGVEINCHALSAGGAVAGGPCGGGPELILEWHTTLATYPVIVNMMMEPAIAGRPRKIRTIMVELEKPASLADVQAALTSKFGKPAPVRGGLAAVEWRNGDLVLAAERDLTEAHLYLYRESDAAADAARDGKAMRSDL